MAVRACAHRYSAVLVGGTVCGAVKCAKTHKCANAHICANISPTKWKRPHLCKHFAHKMKTPTFVQTFRPQMCKQPHLYKHFAHQPQMCKHHAYKCANVQFWREMCKQHPTNVQIIVFIKNQFTSTKLVLSQYLYTQVRSLVAIFSEGP